MRIIGKKGGRGYDKDERGDGREIEGVSENENTEELEGNGREIRGRLWK